MEEPSRKKLKLCENKSSETGNLTGPPSTSSNTVLQSPKTNPTLSPENWELIFRDIHSQDFQSVINTCPEWNQLMTSRKTTELLPSVLPILMKLDHLPATSILNCRLVNRRSKLAIDNTIQHEVSCPNLSFKNEMQRRWKESRSTGIESLIGVNFDFEDDSDIQRFLRHIETKPFPTSNPFLSKQISIGIGYVLEEDVPNWRSSFESLLSRYGHHLRRLTSYMCTWTLGETVTTLLSLMNQMPNLQVLKMIGCIYMREEVERIRNITLPQLDHLESLDLEDFMSRDLDSEEHIVLPFLQHYGSQIKTFRCRGELLGRTGLSAELLNQMLPNVKQLCVSHVTLSALPKLAELNWPVEHLQLFECSIVDGGFVFIQNLNLMITQFSNSLKELDLFVKLRKNLELPGLEELPSTSNDLQGLPNLRILRCLLTNVMESWFWTFAKFRCGELRELHFCTDGQVTQVEMGASRQGFEILPRLERIVFWKEFRNHRKQKCRIITR
ncbi:unnamed protein product [Orchesella dallaii]|uniref:F-box domain-containing protein n=1 Tax=Orchesella dallaii TaxID=48710 RepID=A0ABP1S7S6_9HEXA